jgi:uncharacterized protein (DUF427 family)
MHEMPESVWDYPRPPALEHSSREIRIVFDGAVIAESTRALRVLETSHPPVYYLPAEDILPGVLERSSARRGSFCEWKGVASYYDVIAPGGRRADGAAWGYADPSPGFRELLGAVAFYPSAMDECTVDGELVTAQPGDFYGGWITSEITGPFKGAPGTQGW